MRQPGRQPRPQGLSSLPPLVVLPTTKGGREERPWKRGCQVERTICYRKKTLDISFSCVCPVIDHEFRHNIVKVVGYRLVDPELL